MLSVITRCLIKVTITLYSSERFLVVIHWSECAGISPMSHYWSDYGRPAALPRNAT